MTARLATSKIFEGTRYLSKTKGLSSRAAFDKKYPVGVYGGLGNPSPLQSGKTRISEITSEFIMENIKGLTLWGRLYHSGYRLYHEDGRPALYKIEPAVIRRFADIDNLYQERVSSAEVSEDIRRQVTAIWKLIEHLFPITWPEEYAPYAWHVMVSDDVTSLVSHAAIKGYQFLDTPTSGGRLPWFEGGTCFVKDDKHLEKRKHQINHRTHPFGHYHTHGGAGKEEIERVNTLFNDGMMMELIDELPGAEVSNVSIHS